MVSNAQPFGYIVTSRGAPLHVRAAGNDLPLVRLSPADVSFEAPGAFEAGAAVPLALADPKSTLGPFAYRIVGNAREGSQLHVTAELAERDLRTARSLAGWLETRRRSGLLAPQKPAPLASEEVTDPERIERLLEAMGALGCRAIARRDGAQYAARLSPEGRVFLPAEMALTPGVGPIDVEVSGLFFDYGFRLDPAALDARPQRLVKLHRRSERRVPCPGGAVLSFVHPLWSELEIQRPLLEVSLSGGSIAVDPASDLVFPGLRLDRVSIEWKRGATITLSAIVRHVSRGVHGAQDTCGLSFVLSDAEACRAWGEEMAELLCPHARTDAIDVDGVWDAYVRSGYLGLSDKRANQFAPLKPAFAEACRKIAAAPAIGSIVTLPGRGRVEATIAMLKVFRHGWLVYQLARHAEDRPLWLSGNEILREIYLRSYEHSLADPELRWHIAYVQDSAHWSRLVHLDLPQRYADGRQGLSYKVHAWEGATRDTPLPAPPGVELGEASPGDLDTLVRYLEATRQAPYLDSQDLVRERIELHDIAATYAAAGFERGRRVFVAHQGGKLSAAVVADIADDGLHLFGLLDLVRFYALTPDGAALAPILMSRAAAFYGSKNKRKFVFFDEGDGAGAAAANGMTDLGGATVMLLAREHVPDLLEHVLEVTAPKPLRQRMATAGVR